MALKIESETKSAELAETKAIVSSQSQDLALKESENSDFKEQLKCKNEVIQELRERVEALKIQNSQKESCEKMAETLSN